MNFKTVLCQVAGFIISMALGFGLNFLDIFIANFFSYAISIIVLICLCLYVCGEHVQILRSIIKKRARRCRDCINALQQQEEHTCTKFVLCDTAAGAAQKFLVESQNTLDLLS